ncbi:hypothetical protein FRC08_010012 [Ceratobasidium sp. 394]|nr:hypothetical protein FRC08_010012 [Ceratobasidium sp. 394]
MDDDNVPNLADFFFHNAGDEASYSSSLESLFVCYTLTRGLQLGGTNLRRPALPLELILRITRFAGYMDANPDPSLTLDIDQYGDFCSPSRSCSSPPLSRKHITSMARIHFVPKKPILSRYFAWVSHSRDHTYKARLLMTLSVFI